MATFRIRFVNSPGFIGDMIDLLSNGVVDHAEFDSGTGWLGAHYQDGVQDRPYDYMVPSREFVFELQVRDDVLANAMEWAASKIGTPYNFGAIASIALHDEALNETGKLICSQFAYEMLLKLGYNPLNKQVIRAHDVTPAGLMLSPIFDGKLVK
jgi:uncharacterized protein YycO